MSKICGPDKKAINIMEKKEFSFKIGDKTLKVEKSIMAEQANGSLLISCGETIVLSTAVMSKSAAGLHYFPLNVEYQEKYYAGGKIPGSFLKREARPTDGSILTARLKRKSCLCSTTA